MSPIPTYSREAAYDLCKLLTSGTLSDSEIASLLAAIAARGETVDEVVGMAQFLRDNCIQIPVPGVACMDVCGTGGSQLPRMNTSTVITFVLAASGVAVAKHGNRAASGRVGCFDVLEKLGIPVEQPPHTITQSLKTLNCGFIYAPLYHPLMARVATARKLVGARTIFNLLGPLVNPTLPKFQLVGTTNIVTAQLLATALSELGTTRAIVVAGHGGLDDFSLTGASEYIHVEETTHTQKVFDPREYNIPTVTHFESVRGGSAYDNALTLRDLLRNKGSASLLQLVTINASFALIARGTFSTFDSAYSHITSTLQSQKPFELLNEYKTLTQSL